MNDTAEKARDMEAPGRIRRNILLIVLFLGCMALGFFCTGCHKTKSEATDEKPDVEVANPQERDSLVSYSPYSAVLESSSKADVVARVNGQIVAKHFQSGAQVRKGQVLFTIEPSLYTSSVAEAKAQVASAKSQLDYAAKHLAALEQAYSQHAVSEMEVIQARSAHAEAVAAVNQAQATLSAANTKMGYCSVVAPVSGRITDGTYDVGAYVSGEGAPVILATVYDETDLSVTFPITDSEYSSIISSGDGFRNPVYRRIPVYIGQNVDDVDDSVAFYADVDYESPSVTTSSGNISLKAKLLDSGKVLRPGMYAKVMLPVGRYKDALLVRDASISTDQRGKYLYVVNDSDEVVYTPIETGSLYDDTLRLVTKGLKATDRYVTRAMISVRNGEKVTPVKVGASGKSVKMATSTK